MRRVFTRLSLLVMLGVRAISKEFLFILIESLASRKLSMALRSNPEKIDRSGWELISLFEPEALAEYGNVPIDVATTKAKMAEEKLFV